MYRSNSTTYFLKRKPDETGGLTLQPWERRGCRKGRPQQFWQYNDEVKLTQKEGERLVKIKSGYYLENTFHVILYLSQYLFFSFDGSTNINKVQKKYRQITM